LMHQLIIPNFIGIRNLQNGLLSENEHGERRYIYTISNVQLWFHFCDSFRFCVNQYNIQIVVKKILTLRSSTHQVRTHRQAVHEAVHRTRKTHPPSHQSLARIPNLPMKGPS
jgi:hypothetical protein